MRKMSAMLRKRSGVQFTLSHARKSTLGLNEVFVKSGPFDQSLVSVMISKYFYFYNCNFENETQLLKS
jgi:hypothetical protein